MQKHDRGQTELALMFKQMCLKSITCESHARGGVREITASCERKRTAGGGLWVKLRRGGNRGQEPGSQELALTPDSYFTDTVMICAPETT